MKKTITTILASLSMLWISVGAATETSASENIDMFVGEIKLFQNIDVERVAIGNGKLIKVEILPSKQLLIIGEAAGSTTLHLWHVGGTEQDFNIRLSDKDPEKRVRLEKMIHMDVKIVEFRKSRLDDMGIDWSKSIAGPTLATAGDAVTSTLFRGPSTASIAESLPLAVDPFQTYFGIATEITSKIKYLESSGDATTLAQPTLSTRNGGVAKFLAGGEVPYPVVNENGQTSVSFKEYGIKLDIAPVVGATGIIEARIATEVSQIDPAVNVLGSPGFLTRKTESELNVKDGETIVLAGLLNRELSNNSDKVPGLGSIPVLGWLFKSENYRNNVTELVVFVTPRVVDAASAMNKERIEKANNEVSERVENTKAQLKIGIME